MSPSLSCVRSGGRANLQRMGSSSGYESCYEKVMVMKVQFLLIQILKHSGPTITF